MDPEIRSKIPILADPGSFPYDVKVLSNDPPIIRIRGLLTVEECEHIIELARPKLTSSTMIVNNREVVSESRNSRSAFITENGDHPTNDVVVHNFLENLSRMCGFGVKNFEGMKVVNYQKGQRYYAHHDYFKQHDKFLQGCGDRILTFFVYLNTVDEKDGGSTSFPNLGIKSQPVAGDAVFWVNMDFNGNYFDNTLHSGDEIVGDIEKWGVNVWVRQRGY